MRVPDHVLGLVIAGAILAFVVLHILSDGVGDDGHEGTVQRQERVLTAPSGVEQNGNI